DVTTEPGGTRDHGSSPDLHPPTEAGAGGGVFEHEDFDALLQPLNAGNRPAAVASPPAPSSSSKRIVSPSPSPGPPAPLAMPSASGGSAPALVLTRRTLTV